MKKWMVLLVLLIASQSPAFAEDCGKVTSACQSYCQAENAVKQKFNAIWNLPQVQRNQGRDMTSAEEDMLACHAYKSSMATLSYFSCERSHHPNFQARQAYGGLIVNEQKFQQSEPLFQEISRTPEAKCSKAWASPVPAKR